MEQADGSFKTLRTKFTGKRANFISIDLMRQATRHFVAGVARLALTLQQTRSFVRFNPAGRSCCVPSHACQRSRCLCSCRRRARRET